jgi:hypothetical protein
MIPYFSYPFALSLEFCLLGSIRVLLGLQIFALLKIPFALNMILLSISLVDLLFVSQFDAHAQFGSCWGLVLKCYESRTRQHKMLNIKALRPSDHYFPSDIMNLGRRS